MGSKKSHLMTGMFIGTVLGGLYSMLFASKKGSTVRNEIKTAYVKGHNVFEVLGKELQLTGKESVKAMKELFESDGFQEFMAESKKRMDEMMKTAKHKGSRYTEELKKKFEYLASIASQKAEEIEEEEQAWDDPTPTKARKRATSTKTFKKKGIQK